MQLILAIAASLMDTMQPADVGSNPYAEPTNAFEIRLKDAQFGKAGADRALQDWLTSRKELTPAQRRIGYQQLCGDFAVLTWNKARQSACAELERIKRLESRSTSGDDEEAMANALANEPPVRAIGSARVPLIWNRFGSQSADVTVNGVTVPWFMDTGAEISVVTRSLAERSKVRIVAERVRVGTSTSDVFGQVGMIDVLQIGSAFVENVPVLILPDAQLKIGNVHQIDAILGLPVFVAFGRVAWVDGGTMLALGELAPKATPTAPKIYWHESGLGVPVATSRGIMGAHLDTGANKTDWREEGLRLIDPAIVATAKERITHLGGAGGVVEVKQRELSAIQFRLGGVPVELSKVSVQPPGPESAARIGMDAVSQFGVFTLDFEQMRVDGRLKNAQELATPGWRTLTADDLKLEPESKETSKP